MADLVQWLTAQLAEDERIARACPGDGEWHAGEIDYVADLSPEKCDHIAEHDPARVLREVEMKRRIVDAHERRPMPKGDTADCAQCWGAVWPCPTLRLLALPYDDRDGYQEAWRP